MTFSSRRYSLPMAVSRDGYFYAKQRESVLEAERQLLAATVEAILTEFDKAAPSAALKIRARLMSDEDISKALRS